MRKDGDRRWFVTVAALVAAGRYTPPAEPATGRPLTGRIVETRPGRFEASLPEHRGSRQRHRELLDTRTDAEAWLAIAVEAVNAGNGGPPLNSIRCNFVRCR